MQRPWPDLPWALVLGCSRGIGKACVERLCTLGMHVVGVHFASAERLPEVTAFLQSLNHGGQRAWFYNENAASAAGQSRVIDAIKELVGPEGGLKTVVHSIAFGSLVPFIPSGPGEEHVTRSQLTMTVDVMANSLVYWVQELFCAGLLRSGAQILAITSAGGTRVWPSYGPVSAAKAALDSHVRQLAFELAPHQIAVNAVRPGVTDTQALRTLPTHPPLLKRIQEIPNHRLTRPEDVAYVVGLLAQAEGTWLTGNVVGVDGVEGIVM